MRFTRTRFTTRSAPRRNVLRSAGLLLASALAISAVAGPAAASPNPSHEGASALPHDAAGGQCSSPSSSKPLVSLIGWSVAGGFASTCDNNGANTWINGYNHCGQDQPNYGGNCVDAVWYVDNNSRYRVWFHGCPAIDPNNCGMPGQPAPLWADCFSPNQLFAVSGQDAFPDNILVSTNTAPCGTAGGDAPVCSSPGPHASIAWTEGTNQIGQAQSISAACFKVHQYNIISMNYNIHSVIWLGNGTGDQVYLDQTYPGRGWRDCFTENNEYWFSQGNQDNRPGDIDISNSSSAC
jgi:hypothetical protein